MCRNHRIIKGQEISTAHGRRTRTGALKITVEEIEARLFLQGDLERYQRDLLLYGQSIWVDENGSLINVSPYEPRDPNEIIIGVRET
jgi:hypothetical protein